MMIDLCVGLNKAQCFLCISLSPFIFDCNHDVDFCLIWLNPFGEEEIDVTNHVVVGSEDEEGRFEGISEP